MHKFTRQHPRTPPSFLTIQGRLDSLTAHRISWVVGPRAQGQCRECGVIPGLLTDERGCCLGTDRLINPSETFEVYGQMFRICLACGKSFMYTLQRRRRHLLLQKQESRSIYRSAWWWSGIFGSTQPEPIPKAARPVTSLTRLIAAQATSAAVHKPKSMQCRTLLICGRIMVLLAYDALDNLNQVACLSGVAHRTSNVADKSATVLGPLPDRDTLPQGSAAG